MLNDRATTCSVLLVCLNRKNFLIEAGRQSCGLRDALIDRRVEPSQHVSFDPHFRPECPPS